LIEVLFDLLLTLLEDRAPFGRDGFFPPDFDFRLTLFLGVDEDEIVADDTVVPI
jgi:hypothetical protein